MRVAGAVDVAHLLEGFTLLPLGERDNAEGPVGCRKLEDVFVVFSGCWSVEGVGCSAARDENAVLVARVGGSGVADESNGAIRTVACCDGVGARAEPQAELQRVGMSVRVAGKFAFVRGVVALAAEAVARPKTACEYGGKNALLVRAERTRLQHAHDWFTENAALVL